MVALTGLKAHSFKYAEADVVIATMLKLMDQGVPAYPVFDSIIIPITYVRLAACVLHDEFYQRIGLKPRLKTKSRLPGASEAIHLAIHDEQPWVSALDLWPWGKGHGD
ncbi:hypothetical protein [Bradyrhizobium embrapense]